MLDTQKPEDENLDEQRVVGMVIPRRLILSVLSGDVVIDNIPDGAKILNAGFDSMRNGIVLLVQHPSFEVVPLYQDGPTFPVSVRRVEKPEESKPIQFREFL